MEPDKIYTGHTEDEIWQQLRADINEDTLGYQALIIQGAKQINFLIDIDPGGGFESGYAITSFTSPLTDTNFKFIAHDKDFVDEIGKLLGMQDVEVGFPELDDHLIIKTNNEDKIKSLFAMPAVIAAFTTLANFDFGIKLHSVEDSDQKQAFLELNIQDGITDSKILRQLYHAFCEVLDKLEQRKDILT